MKKRNSKQIKAMIILVFALIVLLFIGLIIFILNIDVKKVSNINLFTSDNEASNEQVERIESVKLEDYDFVEENNDLNMSVKISNRKVILKIQDEEKEVIVHGNTIVDTLISEIKNKKYMLVLTDKGSIGVMDLEEAMENDVFRIRNALISIEQPIVRMVNANIILSNGEVRTVIVTTSDNNYYDLAEFVE